MVTDLKTLTLHELAEILKRSLTDPMVVEQLAETRQLSKLVRLLVSGLGEVFGGRPTGELEPTNTGYYIYIGYTDKVPEGGGIWKDYDQQVSWSKDV